MQSMGISTEQAKQGDVDEQLIPDPSTGFVHESEYAIGQVTVWASKQMEYDESDFDEIFREYFEVLQSGLKA